MPNATGTANTPSELLAAINTLVTANGWTKLRGETDMNCASPKAARYWRLLWIENEDTANDFRELNSIEFRTTLGGAAIAGTWTARSVVTGAPPAYFRSADIDDQIFWVKLDAGSATIVREAVIQCQTDNEAPRDFMIQWSNDDLTWTTMYRTNNLGWIDNETKIFQFDDGYIDPIHTSGTEARRIGFDVRSDFDTVRSFTDPYAEWCDDRFIWQAPGYDANRRIYIQAQGHSNLSSSSNYIRFTLSPEYDGNVPGFHNQIGGTSQDVLLIFDINPIEYWIYMNSTRLIVIVKNGADDYTSAYIGFLGAFADPDNFPHPLFMSATSYQFDAYNVTDNRLSSMCDPGDNAAWMRLWDNNWYELSNRNSSGLTNVYKEFPVSYVWPYHIGGTDRGNWPFTFIGDYVDFDNHFLNQQDPTAQGDYPLYPAIAVHREFGNIGAMQGVYVIPGGVVVPEQVVTISAVNYRAFPNRDRRDGCNWFLVRED
jgi:hypothetical protein